jgi:hypothetical protein
MYVCVHVCMHVCMYVCDGAGTMHVGLGSGLGLGFQSYACMHMMVARACPPPMYVCMYVCDGA